MEANNRAAISGVRGRRTFFSSTADSTTGSSFFSPSLGSHQDGALQPR